LTHSEAQTISKNIGWLFFDKAIRIAGSLLIGSWVARYLGPAQFGVLNYAIALTSLFAALCTLGMDGLITRDLVSQPMFSGEIMGTALALRTGSGIVMIMLVQIAARIARPQELVIRNVVVFISVSSMLRSVDVLKPWFESQVRSKYTVLAENSAFIFALLVNVVLILSRKPLVFFAAVLAGEVVLSEALLWLFYIKTTKPAIRLLVRLRRAKSLLTEGWPLILSSISVMCYMRMDQVMLASMAGDEAVGIYSAAVRVSEIWYFVPMAIVASVAPSLTVARLVDQSTYKRRFQQLLTLLAALSYAVIILLSLTARFVTAWLYGSNFKEAGTVLTLHVWAGLFVSLGVASGRWLLFEGLTGIILLRTITGLLLNLSLNLFLIPKYGAIGAASATVISHGVSDVLMHVFSRESRLLFLAQMKALVLISSTCRSGASDTRG
jgi:PST family polysaccharide transporter